MSYCGYITRIKDLRKHSNADRLQVGTCFGNSVIVNLDYEDNQLGCYFPTDGRLGMEYCVTNNLLRQKDANGNQCGGYLDPEKRHVSTLKLRGENSDGLFMPLSSLADFTDINSLVEGSIITTLRGVTICEKYIPAGKPNRQKSANSKTTKKEKKESYPLFEEHIDTSQLAYNKHQFKYGDTCYITLKMHGTSGRTSHTIKETKTMLPKKVFNILRRFGYKVKIKKNWDYVSGTRRTILNTFDGGFYGSDDFRKKWHDLFNGRLNKGITVYYEIVGYQSGNRTIMPECSNKKTNDKEFIKQYGEFTKFTYGCEENENDIYVYRITSTNEDGDIFEMPWEVVKLYCEKIGVKHVMEFDKFLFTDIDDLMRRVDAFVDGADPIGKSHVREGIVVRIDNKESFTAYKHKNVSFKILEGIIKADDVLDMEEANE